MRRHRSAVRLWAVLVWLLVWEVAALLIGEDILLASPADVIKRLAELVCTPDYWKRVLFSTIHILWGLLLGMVSGVLLGSFAAFLPRVRELFSPIIYVIKAIPVASFIILAVVWLDETGLGAFISFLICLPVFYTNTVSGLTGADRKLVEMTKVYRMGPLKKLKAVYLPALMPYLKAALDVSVGLAWKSGTAAEVIAIPAGSIGEKLYRAKIYFMTGDMLAWTLTIVLLSAVTAFILKFLMTKAAGRWGGNDESTGA